MQESPPLEETMSLAGAWETATSVGVPAILGLITLLIAWLTLQVARSSREVAERSLETAQQSHDIAEQSHTTSQQALDVAIKDWKQIGREAPWNLTKLQGTRWLLERLHHDPAAIVAADVEPHCGGSAVTFFNSAGIPLGVYRRTDKVVIDIPATNPGSHLVLYYRAFAEDEDEDNAHK